MRSGVTSVSMSVWHSQYYCIYHWYVAWYFFFFWHSFFRCYHSLVFCDYMQSMTVMPRQDSPLSILKRSLQLRPPIMVTLPVLGSRGLGDVVDDILFESLLFIIPTARRVCSTQDELDCPVCSAWEPLTSVRRNRYTGRRVGWTLGLKVYHLYPSSFRVFSTLSAAKQISWRSQGDP